MIRITDFDNSGEVPSVEFDIHTPVTVTWPEYRRSLDTPVSFGLNGDGGYLELKFGLVDGGLQELVLVSAVAYVKNYKVPAAVFGDIPLRPAAELRMPDNSRLNYSDDLPLAQIAYDDGLEIRILSVDTKSIVPGSPVGFGLYENGELATIYIRWSDEQRDLFLEACEVL